MYVRNLGNIEDEFVVNVPNDEFSGDKKDWSARFGNMTSKTVPLDSLSQSSITMTLTIDKNTDAGNYVLQVRAESQGDTSVYVYEKLYINLTKAVFTMELEKVQTPHRKVNPQDESEIDFTFTLTNTGNVEEWYTIHVETPLGSGDYKDWIMEFEDRKGNRVKTISVPYDLEGSTDLDLAIGETVHITLYVTVAIDENEGLYDNIAISATSATDNASIEFLSFDLTVILPNIWVDNDPEYFFIEPDSGIEEGDHVDINARIFNTGEAETGEFWVFCYGSRNDSPNFLPGNYIAMEKVQNIPAGQFIDVVAMWEDIEGGEHDIYMYADKPINSGIGSTLINNQFSDRGLVLESNENDNIASMKGFEVVEPIERYGVQLSASKTHIELEDDTYTSIMLIITNIGEEKDTYDVSLEGNYDGWNVSLESDWAIMLEPGESKNYSLVISDDPESSGGENISLTITVRSQTFDEIYRSLSITGTIEGDEAFTIPFTPPAASILMLGGGGLVAFFRRRKHL